MTFVIGTHIPFVHDNDYNGVTTINVVNIPVGYDRNPDVMDMQIIDLPADFLNQTLSSIRITDNRNTFIHT